MTTVRRPAAPDAERLAAATRAHLTGWRIPEGVPLSPDTALLPARPDPDLLRTASRTLHTLLVRSCPDTVVLVGRRPGAAVSALVDVGSVATPLGAIGVDIGRAARISVALGDPFELLGGERLAADDGAAPSGIETAFVLLQVLAPGCRVVPILLADGAEPGPREIGALIARLFAEEQVVLAGGTELARESAPDGDGAAARERLRTRDAELIRPLLDLELDAALRLAAAGAASAPAVLETVLAHAFARGADRGHLIEYARSEGEPPSAEWSGRAGIVY